MTPNAFALYTTTFLTFEGAWLLLKRAPEKRFAPGRWTGLGGRVEAGELGDLRAAALRELLEETGLQDADVTRFALRRALFHNRPGEPLTGLLYYTAELRAYALPACSEGTLHWLEPAAFGELDIIETTAWVLPELVGDVAQDPEGHAAVQLGAAHYSADGGFRGVSWGP